MLYIKSMDGRSGGVKLLVFLARFEIVNYTEIVLNLVVVIRNSGVLALEGFATIEIKNKKFRSVKNRS